MPSRTQRLSLVVVIAILLPATAGARSRHGMEVPTASAARSTGAPLLAPPEALAPAEAVAPGDAGFFRNITLTMKNGGLYTAPSQLTLNAAQSYVEDLPRDVDGAGPDVGCCFNATLVRVDETLDCPSSLDSLQAWEACELAGAGKIVFLDEIVWDPFTGTPVDWPLALSEAGPGRAGPSSSRRSSFHCLPTSP